MTNGFESVPARWRMSRLDRVATVNARIGWKALTAAEYQPEGYAFLATPNIKNPQIDYRNVNYISEFRYEESPELKLREGDVLLAKDGNTLGIVNLVRDLPRPATVNGSIAVLRSYGIHPAYLRYVIASNVMQGHIGAVKDGMGVPHLFQRDIKRFSIPLPPEEEQCRIVNFLDAEVGKINSLVAKKLEILSLLEERIDSRILGHIGASQLVNSASGLTVRPIRRLLTKVSRPAAPTEEVITAFRDGQVTARSLRRADGYTLSASTDAQGQHVEVDDVVIHGLDGFAGAIGMSEAAGNCSPVYHVCVPRNGGDPAFYGRLLRVLAVSEYLGLFATSTRERAVDFRSWDLFGAIPIPNVALREQAEIGDWVRSVPPLRSKVERSNALAVERRQALITAAVTGQFDVSTASGRGIED
ncbi:restriction endonuclease subunit S [Streptomyces sp. ISL-98]|uniref:restriction endonuclease subunit S n=1 Tax=Streptomyces sp. ISL-98 TaxID=2819192 RepID=UPI002034FA7A|nr:restriction endonuclease subunit S [Streptomyces sp. ISL-98]